MRHIPKTIPLAPVTGMRLKWVEQAWQDHRSKRDDHRLLLWMWFSLQNTLHPALQGRH
jgi:asparagine synthase (glutamine-hydrolysing)